MACDRESPGRALATQRVTERTLDDERLAAARTATTRIPSPTRRGRRWLQFSIRGLLIITTLIAMGLALFISRFERPRQAVEVLDELGATYRFRDPHLEPKGVNAYLRSKLPRAYFDPVIEVTVYSKECTDAKVAYLASCRELRRLVLDGTPLTDAGLVHLSGLKSLETLNLSGTRVSDEGMEQLANLSSLKRLQLSGTEVTGVGLRKLQSLTELDLCECPVTGDGLAEVARLPELTALLLCGSPVKDAELLRLSAAQKLKQLYLWNCDVTGEGLSKCEGLRDLDWLSLYRTPVTDAGLIQVAELGPRALDLRATRITDASVDRLSKMEPLKQLDLRETELTDQSVTTIKRELPRCRVLY